MRTVQLLRLERAIEESIGNHPDYMEALSQDNWARVADIVHGLRKLIELAGSSPAVRCVVAHTLPERNASTRVLERVGMTCVGEVIDPDDGRVWRWTT